MGQDGELDSVLSDTQRRLLNMGVPKTEKITTREYKANAVINAPVGTDTNMTNPKSSIEQSMGIQNESLTAGKERIVDYSNLVVPPEEMNDFSGKLTDRLVAFVDTNFPDLELSTIKAELKTGLRVVEEICIKVSRASKTMGDTEALDRGDGYQGRKERIEAVVRAAEGLGKLTQDELALITMKLVLEQARHGGASGENEDSMKAFEENKKAAVKVGEGRNNSSRMVRELRAAKDFVTGEVNFGSTSQRMRLIEAVVNRVIGSAQGNKADIQVINGVLDSDLRKKIQLTSNNLNEVFGNESAGGGSTKSDGATNEAAEVVIPSEDLAYQVGTGDASTAIVAATSRRQGGEAIQMVPVTLPKNVAEGVILKVDVGANHESIAYYEVLPVDDPLNTGRNRALESMKPNEMQGITNYRFLRKVNPDDVNGGIKSIVDWAKMYYKDNSN